VGRDKGQEFKGQEYKGQEFKEQESRIKGQVAGLHLIILYRYNVRSPGRNRGSFIALLLLKYEKKL